MKLKLVMWIIVIVSIIIGIAVTHYYVMPWYERLLLAFEQLTTAL